MMTYEAVKTYAFNVNDDGTLAGQDNATAELDRLARQYMENHQGIDYSTALRKVLRENTELARRYMEG